VVTSSRRTNIRSIINTDFRSPNQAIDGWVMFARLVKHFRVILILSFVILLPVEVRAGDPAPEPGGQVPYSSSPTSTTGQAHMEDVNKQADIDVYLTGPNGSPLEGSAMVTLKKLDGSFVDQKAAKDGYARFNGVRATEFRIQVLAPKYEATEKQLDVQEQVLAKITIELAPLSAEDAASSESFYALPPKTQRDVGKALEELRAKRPSDARKHLEAAQKSAPTSAEIEYLFGVYAAQANDKVQARAYWLKTLELNPKHLSALLAVGQDFLQDNKSAEALPYLTRAAEAGPSSWRAHALLSEALVLQRKYDDAVKQAELAIQLGHERAVIVQPILARALAGRGDREEATKILQAYVQAHPSDAAASKDLEILKNPNAEIASGDSATAASEMAALTKEATALPVPSNWLPPDVDETVPPVVAGATCDVNDVVSKAGKQIMVLVSDVDRFAATETLTHESINKYGMASAPEKRKFNYVASIQEVQRGFLNVEEYRNGIHGTAADFPGGVATNGLPALVLIFHPYNAVNFAMTCEGLAQLRSGPAWQVHFRQRPDKPNVIKRYRIGVDGPSYPVALKGRAWISSDTYQIVRLETDLVAPVPQIKLLADRADIEYGPVKFAKSNVNMWLPQSADVYYDWKGQRIHRRHSFSEYLLFAVDDKQKISTPKVDDAPTAGASVPGADPSDPAKQKP
jgi:tetratricopeptide (TPR) repeat protein